MKRKITDIKTEEENASSCTIYMDNLPFASVETGFAAKLGLRIGLEIEEVVVRKLMTADEVVRARDYALKLLLSQTYTKQQIIEALEKHAFCVHAVSETIENLEQLDHIKDEKHARSWVKNRRRTRPTSKRIMRRELISQGVDKSTVDRVLAEIDEADETILALQVARKQVNHYKSLAPNVVKRRLYAFLIRRGFGHETVAQVMRQILTME